MCTTVGGGGAGGRSQMDIRQRDVIAVQAAVSTPTPADDPVCDLLRCYRETVRRADELPAVMWLQTRPTGSSPLARWWRLPRPKFGVEMLVLFHVTRTVDALLREYAARAALGELDEAGLKQREMLSTFRASLRPVKWRWYVVGAVAAAALLARVLLEVVANSVDVLVFGLKSDVLSDSQVAQLRDTLDGFASASSSLSGATLPELANRLTEAGGSALFVLATTILTATYCVLRPASTAFRIKRMLFNLADEPSSSLATTTSTWHVSRTAGLYTREKKILDAGGVRGAREKPFDLLVSGLATVLVGWWSASFYLSDDSLAISDRIATVVLTVAAVTIRFAWLLHMDGQRRQPADPWSSPTGAILPVTRRIVDIRPATEAAGLSVALVTAPLIWYRQSAQLTDLSREAHAQRRGWVPRGTRLLAPLSALMLLAFAPLVFATRTWRLARLVPRGVRDTGVMALAAVTVASVLGWAGLSVAPAESSLSDYTFLLIWLTFPLGVGATQRAQNDLVREYAVPQGPDANAAALAIPVQFHPPPSWPTPPAGWTPTAGWRPNREWDTVPPGWHLWTTGQDSHR